MKHNNILPAPSKARAALLYLTLSLLPLHCLAATKPKTPHTPAAAPCPSTQFASELTAALQTGAAIDTRQPISDCSFHQRSWETFAWATAITPQHTIPRFMTLQTPSDFVLGSQTSTQRQSTSAKPTLTLATRFHNADGTAEGAGAIVEADGNMLVAPNGYPVYASVHMNPSYFQTVQNNLIATGAYQQNAGTDNYFATGALVFKATWLRINSLSEAPAGAFVTTAMVPVLEVGPNANVRPKRVSGMVQTTSATVALLGLHVVINVKGHPEFLWATFEHHLNSPRTPDNTFCSQFPLLSNCTQSNPNNFTLYTANTPFSQANLPTTPASLTFNEQTQTFSAPTSVVLENATGGENFPGGHGPANIAALNTAAQALLHNQQSPFANYDLIGTTWFNANSYNAGPLSLTLNQVNAVGSVNLTNSTAETFRQTATNLTAPSNYGNCFACHNAQANSFGMAPAPNLPYRRISISHAVAYHAVGYETPSVIPVVIQTSSGFAGVFKPANWQAGSNAPASANLVNSSGAPGTITLNNYAAWATSGATFNFASAPSDGYVSFSYTLSGTTPQCPATYQTDGMPTVLTSTQATATFPVFAGKPFGFALNGQNLPNNYGCQSNGQMVSVSISNFSFTPVP